MHVLKLVNCHAAGEVGDVIVEGLEVPDGNSIREIAKRLSDSPLRHFLMNEPRGGLFRHRNLLLPAIDEQADFAFVIFEPDDTPPMSGSNCICVATVLLETGRFPMNEPETVLRLEAPGGVVEVTASCENGKVTAVRLTNLPSFVCLRDVPLEVPGIGQLLVDTAFGGDSFVLVDARQLGLSLAPEEGSRIAGLGSRIIAAANEQIAFSHPEIDWLRHFAFCKMTLPVRTEGGIKVGRQCVTIQPGKTDRSPTGTGCSARMALLHARGELEVGETFVGESIIGSRFECRISGTTTVGGISAVVPEISGSGFITGTQELWIREDDPFPTGYRVTDTWPGG
ncbi:MAG: proline racemase family protein [Planctomycetota bacterium]|nr:proline racemase family protein [Planctomycetota bacterium]